MFLHRRRVFVCHAVTDGAGVLGDGIPTCREEALLLLAPRVSMLLPYVRTIECAVDYESIEAWLPFSTLLKVRIDSQYCEPFRFSFHPA